MGATSEQTHAIVIGGGIAGLLAARVLLNHFARVTLIERDHYPDEPIFRPGVPQGRQGHLLLLKGQHIIASLFPGIHEKLIKHGAIEHDYGSQTLYYYRWGRAASLPPGLKGWNSSRLLLEWEIRQALLPYDQLEWMQGYEVVQLLFERGTNEVKGVQAKKRSHGTSEEQPILEVKADFVVDASGATSHAPQWLEELGFDLPKESEINTFLGYATRFYKPPAHFKADWNLVAIQGSPESKRGGVIMRVENNQWMVILAGSQKDYPPTQDENYLAFSQSLPDPVLYESIKEATPLSPIYGYRRTANRMRHFEHLKRFPERFIVLGDSVCSFNPIYGQGMTVAALEAQALDTRLQKGSHKRKGFSRSFQQKLARILISPWLLAAVADLEHPNLLLRLPQWYMDRLILVLPHDASVLRTFIEVLHMLRSPLSLINPKIIAKILAVHRS